MHASVSQYDIADVTTGDSSHARSQLERSRARDRLKQAFEAMISPPVCRHRHHHYFHHHHHYSTQYFEQHGDQREGEEGASLQVEVEGSSRMQQLLNISSAMIA